MTDSQDERQRLTALYAGMSDEELLKVASDETSLTDEALELLENELRRRNLHAPEVTLPTVNEVEQRQLVTVRQFRDLHAALLAKGMLESVGIECVLADDNMIRLDWFISNLLGGIKLQVGPEDVEAAEEALSQPVPERFDVEGVGEYEQARCPKCGSVEIFLTETAKGVGLATAFAVGVPLPLPRNSWKCDACGHKWHDEEDAGER